jgi:hypothetical protein
MARPGLRPTIFIWTSVPTAKTSALTNAQTAAVWLIRSMVSRVVEDPKTHDLSIIYLNGSATRHRDLTW